MKDDDIKPLQCLIIDDEPPAHLTLQMHIENTPGFSFWGSCMNAVEAIELLARTDPDVIFLDINMPHLSGLEMLDIIGQTRAFVILTTAHADYALESYNYDIKDYLLKPVTSKNFLKTANKILRLNSAGAVSSADSRPENHGAPAQGLPNTARRDQTQNGVQALETILFHHKMIWIKADKRFIPIEHKELIFIESKSNYVHIYNRTRFYTIRVNMSTLTEHLPENFVLTHRSYIVNRDELIEIFGNELVMSNGQKARIRAEDRELIIQKLQARYG